MLQANKYKGFRTYVHMLPWQINKIFIIFFSFLKMPRSAVFWHVLRTCSFLIQHPRFATLFAKQGKSGQFTSPIRSLFVVREGGAKLLRFRGGGAFLNQAGAFFNDKAFPTYYNRIHLHIPPYFKCCCPPSKKHPAWAECFPVRSILNCPEHFLWYCFFSLCPVQFLPCILQALHPFQFILRVLQPKMRIGVQRNPYVAVSHQIL